MILKYPEKAHIPEDIESRLLRVHNKGFDLSTIDPEDSRCIMVRCSQCESMVINNIATHEYGCPNDRLQRL